MILNSIFLDLKGMHFCLVSNLIKAQIIRKILAQTRK